MHLEKWKSAPVILAVVFGRADSYCNFIKFIFRYKTNAVFGGNWKGIISSGKRDGAGQWPGIKERILDKVWSVKNVKKNGKSIDFPIIEIQIKA